MVNEHGLDSQKNEGDETTEERELQGRMSKEEILKYKKIAELVIAHDTIALATQGVSVADILALKNLLMQGDIECAELGLDQARFSTLVENLNKVNPDSIYETFFTT